MNGRITKESLYLRRVFTKDERLEMGVGLAESYNRMAQIEEEEAVMKANIKNQKAGVEQTIGMLSRHLADGFTMENVMCTLMYDKPNINEVTFVRLDTGEEVKSRAMTESERQQEIEFHESQPVGSPILVMSSQAEKDAEAESAANIEGFFGAGSVDALTAEDAGNSAVADAEDEPEPDEEAVFSSTDPEAAVEAIRPEHDAAWGGAAPEPKSGRGRPKGSKNKVTEDAETF